MFFEEVHLFHLPHLTSNLHKYLKTKINFDEFKIFSDPEDISDRVDYHRVIGKHTLNDKSSSFDETVIGLCSNCENEDKRVDSRWSSSLLLPTGVW